MKHDFITIRGNQDRQIYEATQEDKNSNPTMQFIHDELGDKPLSKLIMCGHTHTPRTVKLNSDQFIVNPGSVGMPSYTDDEPILHSMENYSPLASNAIVEKTQIGWTVNHIKVSYDFNLAVREARNRNREDWTHFYQQGKAF